MKRVALLVAFGITAGLAVASPVDDISAAKPKIRWQPCEAEGAEGFDCATFRVPLDYDRPGRRQIKLAVVRLPATDQEHKLGSLFLNPGGPGGSGVEFVIGAGPFLFNEEVRARYDLVGFDPRGIINSSPLRCYHTFEESLGALAPFFFPTTPEEEALVAQLDRGLDRNCRRRGGSIRNHMATADVARDLDRLRQAVGDPLLNYAGYSYGSFLGVTYANLFPSKVGALVVDGVLDPIAWTTGVGNEAETLPFSTRLRSDAGAQATLDEFFRLCDAAGSRCAFSGDSSARFAALAEQLKAQPVEIEDPETGELFPFGYADLVGGALGVLYDSASWSPAAEFLAALEAVANPATLGGALAALEARTEFARNGERYPNFVEGFPGVACSDSDNPDGHAAWATAGADADENFGYFGRPWTWATSPCAVWTGFDKDRYMGPFNHVTANPVLVVGTRFDPATRYEGAVKVDGLLPNSALLTVNGWGHTSLFLSACADDAVAQYLLTGVTPAPGTECDQDFDPFALTTVRANRAMAERQAARAAALEHIAHVGRF